MLEVGPNSKSLGNHVHFSTHHIFGTVQDKMTLILLQCSDNLCHEM